MWWVTAFRRRVEARTGIEGGREGREGSALQPNTGTPKLFLYSQFAPLAERSMVLMGHLCASAPSATKKEHPTKSFVLEPARIIVEPHSDRAERRRSSSNNTL